jgi:hypothetical protein
MPVNLADLATSIDAEDDERSVFSVLLFHLGSPRSKRWALGRHGGLWGANVGCEKGQARSQQVLRTGLSRVAVEPAVGNGAHMDIP